MTGSVANAAVAVQQGKQGKKKRATVAHVVFVGPAASAASSPVRYLTLNIPPPGPPPLPMAHCQKPGVTQGSGNMRENLSSGRM